MRAASGATNLCGRRLALRAAAEAARLAAEKREADGLPEPPRREGMETDLVQRVSAVAQRGQTAEGERGGAQHC